MTGRAAPTRLHLLQLRRQAGLARQGHGLLRSKREALMQALLGSVRERLRTHDLLDQGCVSAGHLLVEAVAGDGTGAVTACGWAARRELRVEVRLSKVWGVPVAILAPTPPVRDFRSRGFDAAAADDRISRAADAFEDVLALLHEAAAAEVRLRRLGAEVQKTSRRINALEERVLPSLARRIKQVREKLGELDRDENARLRRLKARRRNP